jgi:hypothetical protein
MALYWYGRAAGGMPLLRFLAFYQVLEFYFPIHADQEARQRVKSVVKNPAFSPHRETDISRLIHAIAPGMRASGDERSQLAATVRVSMSADAIRKYLQTNQYRLDYFSGKKKHSPAKTRLKPDFDDDSLLSALAERIYEIRCRIVHTKDLPTEDSQLLPFSAAADQMEPDIGLIEAAAQGALVAASRELRF